MDDDPHRQRPHRGHQRLRIPTPRAPDVGLDTSAGCPPRVSVGLVAIEAESERDRDKRRRQRTLFDGIAERYEESRPGYPARVTEFVTTTANLAPGAEILEIGCGTGAEVSFQVTSFEDLAAAEESFDLIISSAAFHWIDPEVAFGKSARLLRPGGWLALLGTDEQYDHPLGPALDDLWVSHGDTGGAWDRRPSAPAHSAPDQAYIRHDGREVSAE